MRYHSLSAERMRGRERERIGERVRFKCTARRVK